MGFNSGFKGLMKNKNMTIPPQAILCSTLLHTPHRHKYRPLHPTILPQFETQSGSVGPRSMRKN